VQFHFHIERSNPQDRIDKIFAHEIYPPAQVITLNEFQTIAMLQGYHSSGRLNEYTLYAPYAVSGILQTIFWQALAMMEPKFFTPAFLELPLRAAFIRQLSECFEEQMHGHFQMNRLLKSMRFTQAELSRNCQRHFGVSPDVVFLNFKLEKARSFLLERQMAIKEASEVLGFPNLGAFTRAYKKRFGDLPRTIA